MKWVRKKIAEVKQTLLPKLEDMESPAADFALEDVALILGRGTRKPFNELARNKKTER